MENGIGHERRRPSVRRRLGGVFAAAALSCAAIVTSFVVSWMSCEGGDDGCGVRLLVAAAAVVPAFLLGGAALVLLSERTSSPILTNVITALAVFFALIPLEMVFLRQIWAVFAFSGLFAVFVAMVLSEPGAATMREMRKQPRTAPEGERGAAPVSSLVAGQMAEAGERAVPVASVPPGDERPVTPRIVRAKRRAAAARRRKDAARRPARAPRRRRRVTAKEPVRKADVAGDNSELVARLESLAGALEGLIAAEEKRESAQRPDMSSVEERLQELSDRIETLAGRVQSAEEARAPKAAGRAAIDFEAESRLVRRQVASLLSGLSGNVSGADLHLHLLAVAALRQRLMELGRRLDGDPLA